MACITNHVDSKILKRHTSLLLSNENITTAIQIFQPCFER